MHFYKKMVVAAAITLCAVFSVVSVSRADDYGISATVNAVNKKSTVLPTKIAGAGTIPEVIGNIVAVGLSLIGIVFFLLALYAGIIWMTAMGNTEKATNAKDILEQATIGLVLVLAAYAITSFVFDNLAPSADAGNEQTTTLPAATNQNYTCEPNGYVCMSAAQCSKDGSEVNSSCALPDEVCCNVAAAPGCRQDADCGAGKLCVSGSCKAVVGQGAVCADDTDCDVNLMCSDNLKTCQPTLGVGATCTRNLECATHICTGGKCM